MRVQVLASKGIQSDTDFEWQAQLRSYWEEDEGGDRENTVMMRMMSATIQYGYEYLGNSSRLVITPLTDRSVVVCAEGVGIHAGRCSLVPHPPPCPPPSPLKVLPHSDGRHPPHPGGRPRGTRRHRQDRDHKGPRQGAGASSGSSSPHGWVSVVVLH